MKTTEKKTTNTSQPLPGYLENAVQGHVANAVNLTGQPYAPYEGPRVASLADDEHTGFAGIRNLASSQNPYLSSIQQLLDQYSKTPASTLSTTRLIDNVPGGAPGSGSTEDYMSPYLEGVLGPMMREIERQSGQRRLEGNADATRAGAFGDTGHALLNSERIRNENLLRTDTTGKVYADAFNNAMGLKSADINRLLDVMKGNATLQEQQRGRELGGAAAFRDLDRYQTGRSLDLNQALASIGATQRGVEQQKLDAPYQDYVAGQQHPINMAQLLTAILAGTPYSKTASSVSETEKPDNSGFQLLGSLGGALMTGGMSLPFSGAASAAPWVASDAWYNN